MVLSNKKADTWVDRPSRSLGEIDLENLYFAPNTFRKKRRLNDHANPGRWLYADLDAVDPLDVLPIPTLAWQTSWDRYQCMWLLDELLPPDKLAALNQRLTYYLGADLSGWPLNKVLRVPGSVSTKYDRPFEVELMWEDGPTFNWRQIFRKVRHVQATKHDPILKELDLPSVTPDVLIRKYWKVMGTRARKLVKTERARIGERSERLWELENLLVDAGMSPEEVLIVVRASCWNKYKGQRRENTQLWREISKVVQRKDIERDPLGVDAVVKKDQDKNSSLFRKANRFMRDSLPAPAWMVEGIWSDEAHGLIAGEAKTYKTLIALDMAVSVATGTKFLNQFDVPRTGPVMFIQEENRPSMIQDRLRRITAARGLLGDVEVSGDQLTLFPESDIPLYVANNTGLDLTDEEWVNRLDREIARINPTLVVMDPLYRVSGGLDENSARDMNLVLGTLLNLKFKHNCGILLIHHFHKAPADPSQQRRHRDRISGSGVFGRWFESNLYLEASDTEENTVFVTPEHRNSPDNTGLKLSFEMDHEGSYRVEVDVAGKRMQTQEERIADLVNEAPGMTVAKLAELMGLSKSTVTRKLKDGQYILKTSRKRANGGRPPLCVWPPKESVDYL